MSPYLVRLINDRSRSIDDLAEHLDALSPEARWDELSGLGKRAQARLFAKAESGPPITLDHFVPIGTPPLTAVHHRGRNTLPLLPADRFFEKRFCLPEHGSSQLFGYNDGRLNNKVIGPGYFVAALTASRPRWSCRGAVVIDYYRVPDGAVAPGWPEVVPNTVHLQRYFLYGSRDYMRRVSEHVSVGKAYSRGIPNGAYFVLCREP